ncbi:MAG TPA: hypothetical protein VEB63_10585 [Chitinophagaceae bacterium]|nr:hypothetical protein [Chitinophagaceae bacterium]
MLFEDFDKKILDAADHHHPAYDEHAWKKMRRLLNTHLPERKRRRRGLILLFFLGLAVGGGMVLFTELRSKGMPVVEKSGQQPGGSGTVTPPDANNAMTKKDELVTSPAMLREKNISRNTRNSALASFKRFTTFNFDRDPDSETKSFYEQQSTVRDQFTIGNSLAGSAPLASATVPQVSQRVRPGFIFSGETMVSRASRKKQYAESGFALSASLGPDLSATGWSTPGPVKLLGGIGLGYTFRDRLTLRTGFYSGRKVYSASANEYSPPPVFWTYYSNLDKVDADCDVYEIPVTLSYRFAAGARGSWFAGAGASSYLMKKETYNYHYKDTYGRPTSREYTIRDQNRHYFSVLTLSGGYQRRLNNNFSVAAEPYFKLPVSGVGYGKVKLNSAGVMLSASFRPFAKSPR